MPFNIATETISSFLEEQAEEDAKLGTLLKAALLRPLSRELANQKTPDNLIILPSPPENASEGLLRAFSKEGHNPIHAFAPDSMMQEHIKHISDWLKAAVHNNEPWLSKCDEQGRPKKLLKMGSIEQVTKEANKAMLRFSQKAAAKPYDDASGERTVITFADNYRIVQLLTPEALDRESAYVQHCIGEGAYDYKLKSGSHIFYSLRDPQGKGHATMEVKVEGNNLMQCKGKENKPPISRYMPYIQTFLKRKQFNLRESARMTGLIQANGEYYDIHHLPENFVIDGNLDLNGTDIKSLPRNISATGDIILFQNNSLTSLKSNMSAGGNISIRDNDSLTSLNCDLFADGEINLRCKHLALLDGEISAKKDIHLVSHSGPTLMPAHISSGGNVSIECSRLTSLPGDIVVDGDLNLRGTLIRTQPKNLFVKGNTHMPFVGCFSGNNYDRDT